MQTLIIIIVVMFNIIPNYSYVHWNTTLTHWELTLKPNYFTICGKKMTHDTKMAKQNLRIIPLQFEFHFQNLTKKYLSSLLKNIQQKTTYNHLKVVGYQT